MGKAHSDLLSCGAAFLMPKDSKVSYTIQGEIPLYNRIEGWRRTIDEAGKKCKISVQG